MCSSDLFPSHDTTGVEVSKDGAVYRYAIIGINDEYKAKKALISKILGIASYLNNNKPLKKG